MRKWFPTVWRGQGRVKVKKNGIFLNLLLLLLLLLLLSTSGNQQKKEKKKRLLVYIRATTPHWTFPAGAKPAMRSRKLQRIKTTAATNLLPLSLSFSLISLNLFLLFRKLAWTGFCSHIFLQTYLHARHALRADCASVRNFAKKKQPTRRNRN